MPTRGKRFYHLPRCPDQNLISPATEDQTCSTPTWRFSLLMYQSPFSKIKNKIKLPDGFSLRIQQFSVKRKVIMKAWFRKMSFRACGKNRK